MRPALQLTKETFMSAYLSKTALRFHERLLRYHRLGFAWNIAECNFLPSLYHGVCMVIETFAVAYHKREAK